MSFSNIKIKKFLRQHYGLAVSSVQPIKNGVANFNFYVSADNKKYLFKIYRYRTLKQTDFEIKILYYLSQHHFNSPAVVKNVGGKLFGSFDNKPCALFIFVAGQPLKKINAKVLVKIGAQIAILHKLLKNKKQTVVRENWDLIGIIHRLKKNKQQILTKNYPHKQIIISFLETELAKINLPNTLPQGLTHQDIKPGNIIVDKGGRLHFIDFDNMYYGAWLIDAMTTIIWSAFRNNKLDKKLWSAFWKGYASQRPLTAIEKNNLYEVLKFRLLREAFIWIWLYSDKQAQKLCKHFLNCYKSL